MAFPTWRKSICRRKHNTARRRCCSWPDKAFTPHPASPPLLQQAGNHAGHAVGLFQHGDASLHQHLLFGHIGRFRRVVGIHNVTDSDFGVVLHTGQVVGGVVQTVDRRTQPWTGSAKRSIHRGRDAGDHLVSRARRGQLSTARKHLQYPWCLPDPR
ncbi:Uncharacterised protein [Escherichia coli]|uniref:Uncharacterized protein n=1 Tax=Escherichia coli TaxID=562 RepID=A0A376L1P4_ECOLX|nr:Uncharacterised protein [Escherichia coli]